MAGVFDSLMSDDPKEQAYMALAAGLLSGRGNFNKVAGEALMGSQNVYRQAQEAKARQQQQMLQQQMMQMQLDAAKRQQRLSGMAQQFVRPGMKPETMDNRDVGMPGEQAVPATSFDMPGYITALMGEDPVEALKLQAATAKQTPQPVKLSKDDRLVHPTTFQTLVGAAPEKPEKDPEDIRVLKIIYGEGTPEYRQALELLGKKKTTHAPAANTSINVSTEKKYGEHFAEEVARADVSLKDSASKAPELANRAIRVKEIMASGNPITGFGADFRLQASKALAVMGIKSSGDAAADTETLATQLASNTLDAIKASGLGGGTGFSNADRDFLEKAVGGKITLEAKTINRLADLSYRAAVLSADKWNKRSKQIPSSAIQGTGIDTSPVQIAPLPQNTTSGLPSMNDIEAEIARRANARVRGAGGSY